METLLVLIDGPSLQHWLRSADVTVDYRRLLRKIDNYGNVLAVYYFTPISDDPIAGPFRRFVDWLSYNGFRTVGRPSRRNSDNGSFHRSGISVDIVTTAFSLAKHVNTIMLFTGTGDFRCLAEAIQQMGVRVIIVAPLSDDGVADGLRRQADEFVNLSECGQISLSLSSKPRTADDVYSYAEVDRPKLQGTYPVCVSKGLLASSAAGLDGLLDDEAELTVKAVKI